MNALLVTAVLTAVFFSLGQAQGYRYRQQGYGGYRQQGYGHNNYRYNGYYGYKRCPKLDDPENGDVKITSLKPGGKAIYSCDKGYELEGYNTIRICQKNGQWSGKAPICAPIDCGPPPQPDINGQVQYTGTLLGDTATYTCNEGYELEGGVDEVTIECLNTGDWSGPAPECNPVDCGAPPAPGPNGDVASDETTFRKTAIYTCDYGYLLKGGSQQIYCRADKTWSGTPPDCVRIDCGFLPAPKNGDVKFVEDTRLGSYAQFSCDKGFKLVGPESRLCQANGDWSLSQPTCQRIKKYGSYQHGYNDRKDHGYNDHKDYGYVG